MIKNLTTLEVKIDERIYRLICECDAPLGAVHDALCQMKAHIVKSINDIHAAEQVKKESDAEPPKEE